MFHEPDTAIGGLLHRFPSTQHSLIIASDHSGSIGREALSSIIAIYWKPAYKYVRIKWRKSNEDAKDLVQGFFSALIEHNILRKFDPEKGRFRTYLKTCLNRFVMNQEQSANRLKRGGNYRSALNFERCEWDTPASQAHLAADSAEEIFVREWRREVFTLALQDFRTHCCTLSKESHYRVFEQYDLSEEERPSYADLAAEYQLAVTTITNRLAWSRRELRRCVLERLSSVNPNARDYRYEVRLLFQQ